MKYEADSQTRACTAFAGERRIASGELGEVAVIMKEEVDRGESLPILIFDDFTGAQFDIDVRGTPEDVRQRYAPVAEPPRGPGRPKLGVVPREVTLLQSHWDWLNAQSGGASVALRKLVHEAIRSSGEKDRTRQAIEATYRFLSSMAGNLPNFEEASRALYAEDSTKFGELTAFWPTDIRDHANKLLMGR